MDHKGVMGAEVLQKHNKGSETGGGASSSVPMSGESPRRRSDFSGDPGMAGQKNVNWKGHKPDCYEK